MSQSFRATIKRLAPTRLKHIVWNLRASVAAPPIDDSVLAEYCLVPDASDRPRLNLLIPNLTRRQLFGGVKTGLDVFLALANALARNTAFDIRFILTNPTRETDQSIIDDAIGRSGGFNNESSFIRIESAQAKISIRKNDFFVAFNWWCALNVRPLMTAQARHWQTPTKPLLYLLQEYEPHLRQFSSANILAREALDTQERLWGIFNSSNLHSYFERQAHRAERVWIFEPVVHEKLRSALETVASSERAKRILVYGRPSVERNCFPALLRGLKRWAAQYDGASDWEVVSAGSPHKPYDLGNGVSLRPVGKLSIEDYAEMLLTSSVGISLMASPHPSYPPLEMAHFGLRTITNTYADKDLSDYHPNIVSVPSIADRELAGAIARCCDQHGTPVSDARNPEYMRQDPYEFLGDLTRALMSEIS